MLMGLLIPDPHLRFQMCSVDRVRRSLLEPAVKWRYRIGRALARAFAKLLTLCGSVLQNATGFPVHRLSDTSV